MLHPISAFIHNSDAIALPDKGATYWYADDSDSNTRLPRTLFAEAIARGLMQQLAHGGVISEGKMYGILLVETPTGEHGVLKAFSGLLNGCSQVAGWVPPIAGRGAIALEEAQTLSQLNIIHAELIALRHIPERQQHAETSRQFAAQLDAMTVRHRQRKLDRQQQRQQFSAQLTGHALQAALEQLDEQSRRDGIDRRNVKREHSVALRCLEQAIAQADDRIWQLKQQRKALSRHLQAQLHAAYRLTNFAGVARSVNQILPNGIPSGTGDCCAPKLLHYAANHHLQPLAMAEFWWGSTAGDRIQGEFYGACAERCQPMMGFLLSGLSPSLPNVPPAAPPILPPILYEDDWLIAVNKPAGLLSVPGRYGDRQDSVVSRFNLTPGFTVTAVHRLDQDTSGIMLLARDRLTHRQLYQQFQQRQVQKTYEAVLEGTVAVGQGTIDLPLWSDPTDRPYQRVDWQRGKPAVTDFRVLDAERTRVQFTPITGRTHQIRVHAASPEGLGVPILGDRLYGESGGSDRLHLHAQSLKFQHPHTREWLHLQTSVPF